ncbi:ABC transporter substrate-binding protein [uncultured Mesorhizobium sp.]|uniref:ABC transporter substrate-binding protein n=1 Tax=uncultured Mesorhizobium sp. TaxID=233795 RepID=UPI0025987E54|nr:ABC transporter substrate-binding protein [uncultured Mesorhizobium sp.]
MTGRYLTLKALGVTLAVLLPQGVSAADGIVIGTTDKVTSLDPARAYDNGSWMLLNNIYQKLLTFPPGKTTPEPEAADCEFKEETTYVCVLKPDLQFSNGNPVTAEDVAYSYQRILTINDPAGPSSLLASLKSIEASDEKTVVFHLKSADMTWPSVVATAVGSIVDRSVFPEDKLLDSGEVIGSGPYALASYKPGQQAVLKKNPNYKGSETLQNSAVVVQYLQQSSALKLAVEQGAVDIAYRALDPTDIADLRKKTDKVKVIDGPGTDVHFIGFNLSHEPGKTAAVRKALAYTVDRAAILSNVYNGVGEPLYSMVTKGFDGYTEAYKDIYGEKPDLDKARALLADAGVQTPVEITAWWTPSHYGPLSGDEYIEIQRQLESSGLFKVTLQSSEWQQYVTSALGDQYAVYQFGGSADYPNALNAVSAFYVDGGFLNNHYTNPKINELYKKAVAEPKDDVRHEMLAEIQSIYAEEAPTVPLWQGAQSVVTGTGIEGVAETLDATSNIRFWMISKD